jgi:hypothetical protein
MNGPRVYADFNNADPKGRLRLNCAGTIADLSRLGVQLREGLVLTVYMDDTDDHDQPDDLEAVAVVEYSQDEGWVARIDWAAVRHASEARHPDTNGTGGHAPARHPEVP